MANEAIWPEGQTVHLDGLTVSLSAPTLVGRSRGYFWFPMVAQLANGDLFAQIQDHADVPVERYDRLASWSFDHGLTWTEPSLVRDGGSSTLRLPSGDQLLLPYVLQPRSGGMSAPYNLIKAGSRTITHCESDVTVTDWPRPLRPGRYWVTNKGTVTLDDGTHLATLHGYFAGTSRASLVVAASTDGVHWVIRSVVADETCPLPGGDGPSEADLLQLKDGRLLCVFRLGGWRLFGQSWSSDAGRTWTPAVSMPAFSVQPSLVTLHGGRTIVLAGGRPGLYLWFDREGMGERWQWIDTQINHNAWHPDEPIHHIYTGKRPDAITQAWIDADKAAVVRNKHTSSYTELVVLDESHLLYIYDRLPNGWHPIPDDMDDTNSVGVVRITVER